MKKSPRAPKLILYTIPASHYCEKTRWVLDFKKLAYQEIGFMPLWHFLQVKRLPVPKTSLPILQVDKEFIQDSTEIFSYLEDHYPDPPLLPKQKKMQEKLWEINQDMEKLGVHIRRWIYAKILPHAGDAQKILGYQAASWQAKAFNYSYPLMKFLLTKGLGLTAPKVQHSEKRILEGLDKIQKQLAGESFLLGDRFSFADLTAASILGPLALPTQHPVYGPLTLSPEVKSLFAPFAKHPSLQWVTKIYKNWR